MKNKRIEKMLIRDGVVGLVFFVLGFGLSGLIFSKPAAEEPVIEESTTLEETTDVIFAADSTDNNSDIDSRDSSEVEDDTITDIFEDPGDSVGDSVDYISSDSEVYEDEDQYYDVDYSDYSDTDDSWVDSSADGSVSDAPQVVPESDIHYGFTDDEVYEIARIVWLETGITNCSYYTQYLTACVILNRYLDWGYSSLYETIHAPGQYATADMYTEYDGSIIRIGERTWSAVYDALADTDRNPHYQMRGGAGMPVYYWDTEWDVCFYY